MRLQLSAIDTWFFRDGTPFDMHASSQSGVVGMFPPYPPTVAGAIRAALARRNGWNGRGRWSGEIAAVLGDGPADLGCLQLTGPFVLRDGAPIFPMPRHVVGRVEVGSGWVPATLLRPARTGVPSDLGTSVRFPEMDREPAGFDTSPEPGSKQWITLGGLQRVLRGALPAAEEIIHERALWSGESRVGIARTPDSRTVADGALYSTCHARPAAAVSLGLEIDGIPESWRWPMGDVIPLGGESRLAACEPWDAKATIALGGSARATRTAVIVALTPVLLEPKSAGLAIPGAQIVSACTERPLQIGGWDSMARTPLPLKSAARPGSAWFCEIDDATAFRSAIANGLLRIGTATSAGFGLCAIGDAPQWEETT